MVFFDITNHSIYNNKTIKKAAIKHKTKQQKRKPSSELQVIGGGHDDLAVQSRLFELRAKHQRFIHEIVDKPGATARESGNGRQNAAAQDRIGGVGYPKLMQEVLLGLRVRKAHEAIMYGDPLAQRLMDALFKGTVQMGFARKDEREAIHRIEIIVQDHLQIFEDRVGKLMGLVEHEDERLLPVLEQMEQPVLDGLEHGRLPMGRVDGQGMAELAVKLRDADGGKADISQAMEVPVKGIGEALKCKRLPEARHGSKDADAADVLEISEAGGSFFEILGREGIFGKQ